MVDVLHTPVTVQFGSDPDETKGSLQWERDTERVSEDPRRIYLRLYPAAPEKLLVTSGIIKAKSKHEKSHTEILAFVAEDIELSIQYPEVGAATVEQIGSAFDAKGNPTTVSFSYNAAKSTIVASKLCICIIKVKYKAPYQLYAYSFSGPSCVVSHEETEGVAGTSAAIAVPGLVATGGYNEAMILAINFTTGVQATERLQLTPAVCGKDIEDNATFSVNQGNNASPPELKLEVHKDFPPRLVGSSGLNLRMACKVRQIPDVPATIDMSSGKATPADFSGGSVNSKLTSVSAVTNYTLSETEEVKQIIQFSVGYSAKLQYQPNGSVTVKASGDFLNRWGNKVSPTFAKPGDSVIEVDWLSEHTYRNPRSRVVNVDEVVVVTSGNITIEVYGSATVDYTIQYKVYDVEFQQSTLLRPEDGFNNIHMLATYNEQTAHLPITAPSLKEK